MTWDMLLNEDDENFIKEQKKKLEDEQQKKIDEENQKKKIDDEIKKKKSSEKIKSESIEQKEKKPKTIDSDTEKLLNRLKQIEEKIVSINNMQFTSEEVWKKFEKHGGLLRNYLLRGQATYSITCLRPSALDQMTLVYNELIREYLQKDTSKKEENPIGE